MREGLGVGMGFDEASQGRGCQPVRWMAGPLYSLYLERVSSVGLGRLNLGGHGIAGRALK